MSTARTEPGLLQTHHLIRDHYHGAAAYIPFSATAPTSILRAAAPTHANADADAAGDRATPLSAQRISAAPPPSRSPASTRKTPSLFAGQRNEGSSERVAAIWDAERQPRKSSQAPVTQIGRPVLSLHPKPRPRTHPAIHFTPEKPTLGAGYFGARVHASGHGAPAVGTGLGLLTSAQFDLGQSKQGKPRHRRSSTLSQSPSSSSSSSSSLGPVPPGSTAKPAMPLSAGPELEGEGGEGGAADRDTWTAPASFRSHGVRLEAALVELRNALRVKGIEVRDSEPSAHGASDGVIVGEEGGGSNDINGAVMLLLKFWEEIFCPCVSASLIASSQDHSGVKKRLQHLMQRLESCLLEPQSQFQDESDRHSYRALAAALMDANRAQRAQLQRGAEELDKLRGRYHSLCTEHKLEVQRSQRAQMMVELQSSREKFLTRRLHNTVTVNELTDREADRTFNQIDLARQANKAMLEEQKELKGELQWVRMQNNKAQEKFLGQYSGVKLTRSCSYNSHSFGGDDINLLTHKRRSESVAPGSNRHTQLEKSMTLARNM